MAVRSVAVEASVARAVDVICNAKERAVAGRGGVEMTDLARQAGRASS
jgi:hypothetical protein